MGIPIMNFDDIRNESTYSFEDISSERVRRYDFDGVDVEIDDPVGLAVSDNGHRVIDAGGTCHYIGFEGFYLNWEVDENAPHFVK